ncbi:abasic site processing protein HMCES [Drosophila santomea]|uniref:abasic site processing protein HMCES n=1 Tax=Drosophila santomea TaxID=129105 RepID=UPI001954597B|nr:abasic site processing protein HMCES [Drosophila santomea]XP_043862389.1 abasic site processing protein HMCES [Drosophila santomea]
MCGRTCLTLDPDQVICACKYPKKTTRKETDSKEKDYFKDEKGSEMETPEWRAEFNLGRRYHASYNIAPTDITPVIVSAAHFSDAEDQKCARVVMPMMWGMIPFWHKGDYRRHGLTTNNCRLEHLMDSKLYRGPFKRGQRCVVICEGFYEWQTAGPAKKPSEREAYLVFVPQAEDVKIYDKSTWSPQDVKLLRMAGLFDVWEDESGDKMYSYSIITFQSSKIMSWMHYRMPAILETEQQMNDWLDFKRVSDTEALATLRPATELQWHRVTKLVNNSRNKSEECNKPIELAAKPVKPPMNKTMMSWLNVRKKREEQIKAEQSDASDGENEEKEGVTKRRTSADGSPVDSPAKRPRFRDFKNEALERSGGSSDCEVKSAER